MPRLVALPPSPAVGPTALAEATPAKSVGSGSQVDCVGSHRTVGLHGRLLGDLDDDSSSDSSLGSGFPGVVMSTTMELR